MKLKYKPKVLNAKYIKSIGGEGTFCVTGGELYTTQEGKEIECISLVDEDGNSFLYSPNATSLKQLNNEGIDDTEDLKDGYLVLHTVPVMFGAEEVDGIRIKEIRKPGPVQEHVL